MSTEQINRFENLTTYILDQSKLNTIDKTIIDEWKYLYEQVKPELVKYDENKVLLLHKSLMSKAKDDKHIIVTMTTCKRYDLFEQTINSIINHWLDLDKVDQWLIIDDNSSKEDRKLMQERYPFIDYYLKSYDEKGHVQSMNIIYDYLHKLKPRYWIHIEDDMLFFAKLPYITLGLQGLTELSYFNVKQIVFNRNYGEIMEQINLDGHIVYGTGEYSLQDYKQGGSGCRYWPHFSFRPSIIDVDVILKLGDFTGQTTFFENEYAFKYMNAGYRTAFLNTITHLHIGRLCNAPGQNAYTLNNVPQFNGQKIADFNIKVINLKRREDRLKLVTEQLQNECLPFDVFEAVDGSQLTLTDEMKHMFKDNDFNYRRGIIGCALSHYYLWKELVKSNNKYYLIMEDDVKFCNDFRNKLSSIEKYLHTKAILFLGYHMFEHNRKEHTRYLKESDRIIIDYLKKDLFIGGTHCYSITKSAAQSLIDYIDIFGIKNGIDYLIGKKQNDVSVYETIPHLTFAEYSTSSDYDTDIQYDVVSLLHSGPKTVIDRTNKNTVIDISEVKLVDEDEYIFIEGIDQINKDIYRVKENSTDIPEMKRIANQLSDCVAFNTLGYFKNEITELTFSDYYSNKDGIYIKKSYYETVLKKTSENDWIQYVLERSK